jgi:hypothetical protein
MKKIKSLFKRDYEGTRQVYNEIVPGSEWVIAGEGVATVKYDGTACMVRDGVLFKRYDRKLRKEPYKRKKADPTYTPTIDDYKPAPDGWEACEDEPNEHTGHWPGWVPVGDGPEDQYHREAWDHYGDILENGTYELVGQKIGGNPYGIADHHIFWPHGVPFPEKYEPPRDFDGLRRWFEKNVVEGIVWWHPDGRMVKIKRRDFGLPWPEPSDPDALAQMREAGR